MLGWPFPDRAKRRRGRLPASSFPRPSETALGRKERRGASGRRGSGRAGLGAGREPGGRGARLGRAGAGVASPGPPGGAQGPPPVPTRGRGPGGVGCALPALALTSALPRRVLTRYWRSSVGFG